jgi:TDG/mug DNA glycosylase family protein
MDATRPVIRSFNAVVNDCTHTLILGSMPGQVSLDVNQYYAHSRNAFWPIINELLSLPADATYADRLFALQKNGIGLWDVLAQCERQGSLDSDIKTASIVANNFVELFQQHPQINKLLFNGATAERYFQRYVLPYLNNSAALTLQRLPSTSPAHAAQSLATKLSAWQSALRL